MWSRGFNPQAKQLLLIGFVFYLFSVNGLKADPFNLGCPFSDSGILQYVPGNAYEYTVDSLVTIGVGGNEVDEIALKISGKAKIYAEGNCGYTLLLDRLTVSNARESLEKQISQGINKPVKFTLSSGQLQPAIGVDPNDNSASLNIKRAIISLLQVSNKPQETDVFGICPTLTSTTKAGPAEIITKIRNLNACSYRENIATGLISGIVNSKAGIKSSSALSAQYTKELKLARGIVENVQLVEEYKFPAIANGPHAVKAKVRTSLKYGKASESNPPESSKASKESASIVFEQPTALPVKNIVILKKVFTNTVNLVNEHVQGNAAQYFSELIRLMRASDSETLTELSLVPHVNKVLARKVYLDALFRVGTSNAVKAIARQISKMSEQEKKLAFLSFNLVENVEKDALNQAANLLNPSSPKEAYLAVGNLVNKYCKQGTCDQSEVNIVSKKFTDSLKHCKANTKKDEDRFVNILKGIRNTRKIADSSAQVLIECASSDRSARLRVAAIQAFSAASCVDGLQTKALNILKDVNEDSEIRIEAYLALIACPSAKLSNEIADIVNNEPINQVGGFITSSLKAIRDSTDPTREEIRRYFSNIRVTKKFPIDPRRYSFNSELSYAIESLGLGASADYSLIYSQKGFLPRSARLNLTTELFGTNFNVLEVSARQENLENILGHYFGPKGYLKTEGYNLIGNLTNKSRSRRSIADDTGKFAKKYKTYGSRSNTELNLDLAIRVFGSELVFLSLADDASQIIENVLGDANNNLDNLKEKLKNFEHEYACHALFLDADLVYPTGVGLPLELTAEGTSATKLNIATKIDIDAFADNTRQSKQRIKLVPSVDVHVNTQLRLNALVLVAGIRASSNLHSSVGSDNEFELINDRTGFNLDITLPRTTLEILDYKHNIEFLIVEPDKESKIIPIKQKKKKNSPQVNCFDQLLPFGVTVCFSSLLPDTNNVDNTGLPFSGPLAIGLQLEAEKKINIVGTYNKNAQGHQWILKYSTPGSVNSHDTELSLQVGVANFFAKASLMHPQIRLSGEIGIQDDDKELSLYGKYDIMSDITVQKIGFTKHGNEYRPLIEIKTSKGVKNEINGYRAEGRVLKQTQGKTTRYVYENFQLIGTDNKPIVVNGWTEIDPPRVELKVQYDKDTYEIKSHLQLEQTRSIGFFIRNLNTPYTNGASGTLELSPTSVKDSIIIAFAGYNFQLDNDFAFTRDANTIKQTQFKNDLELKDKETVIFKGKLNGELDSKVVKINIEAAKDTKKASLDFYLTRDQRAVGDYNLNVNAKLNQHFVDLQSKVNLKGVRFVTDNSLTSSWGSQLTAQGEIGQRFTPNDVYIDLQGSILISNKDKPGNWLLKAIGTPDKTNLEFKLNRENADLIIFNSETTHPNDKLSAGKVNLQLKDLLGAKVDFKINKGGKGDLTGILNLKKAQRKINLDSKFTIAAPKYDIETTIVYDTDKKLIFKTENIIDKTKVSTKNILDVNGDKILLDVSGLSKGEWRLNGEINGKFTLTVPSGRQFDGQLNRVVTTAKTGITEGSIDLTIGDQLSSNERRSIQLKGKLEKLNIKTNELSSVIDLVYTSFSGKKLDVTGKIKHLSKGSYKSIDSNLELRGDPTNSPINIHLLVDEYSSKHAVFKVSAEVGSHINTNVNGNYYLSNQAAKPSVYDLEINVAMPQSTFKKFNLASNGKYLTNDNKNGIRSLEFNFAEQTGENSVKLGASANGSPNEGSFNIDLSGSHITSPIKLAGSFKREKNQEAGEQNYNFDYTYGDIFIKTNVDLNYVEKKSGTLKLSLGSSFDSIKNLDFKINTVKNDDIVQLNNELQLNGQNYLLGTSLYTGEHKKGVDIRAVLSQKTTTVSGIFETLGERKGKLSINIENLGELDLKSVVELSLKTFNDFYIVSQTNSQKLKIENLNFDVRSQGDAGVKNIELSIKNAKGIILSGTATYTIKKEKSKTILEGQGQVQYYQKSNNANFKIIYQIYDMEPDQEVGFSYTFNGTFGPKNAVSTFKITNKNFQTKLAICEEKKQCTNVDIKSIITIDPNDVTAVQHDLMVLVNLRELGYPHEFELQSKRSHKGFKYNHEIETSIISNNNIKYQLIVSILPQLNKFLVKLPSREIYLETEQIFPQSILGHYQSSATFYFDRLNKPNDVSKIIASADISGIENVAINAKGKIGFENPTIRPLTISGQFDLNRERHEINTEVILDIFKTPEQQIYATNIIKNVVIDSKQGFNITITNQIKSSGLGFQYEASGHTALSLQKPEFTAGLSLQSGSVEVGLGGFIYVTKDHAEITLNGLNEQILNLVAEINNNKNVVKVNANAQLFALKPLSLNAEIDQNSAKISVKRSDLFDAVADLKLGKEAKLVIKGKGKKLFNSRLALDAAHFLATTFESNAEDTRAFLASLEETISSDSKEAKELLEKRFKKLRETIDRQTELAKSSAPDFSALQANIEENLKGISQDLANDPAIKDLLNNYRKHYESALKFYQDISKTVNNAYKQIYTYLNELWSQIQNIIKKNILPIWEDLSKKLTALLSDLQVEIVKLATNLLEQVFKSLKSLENDFKALGKPIYEVLKPLSESLQDLIQILVKDFEELLKDLKEYLSKLPTFGAIQEELKEKLASLKAVDQILTILRNIIDQINSLSTTPESTELANKLYDFIEAKLRNKPINDFETLEDLYNTAFIVLKSLWTRTTDLKPSKSGYFSSLPFSLEMLNTLPIWISLRFSIFNFIINEKLDSYSSYIELFKPPFEFLPPFNLVGHIAAGKNVFTFDGREFILQGSCKYILVQDADKNDFSVIAMVKDGKVKSITLIDAENFIEAADTGVVKLNGAASELPIHNGNIHSWRRYYTIRLRTEYGVEVVCTTDLKICHVIIDGFYTSRTRGLFGNGNAEPFDDFTLVDGKIAQNSAEFTSDYGLGNCPATSGTELNNIEHDAICSDLFAFDSKLVLGYFFIDHRIYRKACDEAVATTSENKEETACILALAYASAAKLEGIPISVPNRCLKCNGPVGQREIGDEFNVKIPTNKADLVFVVDLDSEKNIISNLVSPAITEIRNQLKTRGFTDTQIIVIAFAKDQLYPALLTSNGGKLNYNGELSNVVLAGPSRFHKPISGVDLVNKTLEWLQSIQHYISPQSDELAFRFALQYPFRAGAAKSIIAVRSDHLDYSNIFKFIRAHLTGAITQFNGASLHMIAPVQDLAIDGFPSEKLVGFNSRVVATTDGKDAKKRQKLKFKNDMGIDFILQNNGWVFAAQNFGANNQKEYLNQVTTSIADTLFKTDIISDCKCTKVEGLHPEHKCSIKSSTFIPNKRPKGA